MKKLWTLLPACLAASALNATQAPAPSGAFTLDRVLDYPFPDNLIAAPKGATIAWTFSERGSRNIYAADGPEFLARKVTPYVGDEGQELTSLAFTADGKTIVYVRGGDHGANWPADGNLPPNPASSSAQPRVQVWSVAVDGTSHIVRWIGEKMRVLPLAGCFVAIGHRDVGLRAHEYSGTQPLLQRANPTDR